MASERKARVADRIRVVLAERLEKGLRDPRLGFVTITDVSVTGDLQHASVFYTVYGSDEERASSAEALKAATGLLRSEVGKQLNTRLTPSLEFILDALPENADHISDLLREARERDAAVAGIAAGAQYAGDADPYVKPRDEAEDDGPDAAGRPDGSDVDAVASGDGVSDESSSTAPERDGVSEADRY